MYLFRDPREKDIDTRTIKRRELESFRRISNAWNVPGKNPAYHEAMKRRLRSEWPVLAEALDRM